MILFVPTCFALIGIVLLQKGKGVGFAGAFGLGAGSEAMFGPRGSISLPVRITQVLGGAFFVLALLLSITGGMARRSLAPDVVDAAVTGAAAEASGMQQLEELGLGSAVGGGASPLGGITVVDESGEGEPELEPEPEVELEVEAEDAPVEPAPVDDAAEAEAADVDASEADASEADAEADSEQPSDGS